MELAHRADRIGQLRSLVRPVALDPGEPQRQASRILGARLDVIEGDLDDELGTHVHRVPVASGLELLQLRGLPGEHLVGHALEGLAEHDEPARVGITRAEIEARAPAATAAAPPFAGHPPPLPPPHAPHPAPPTPPPPPLPPRRLS